MIRASLMSAPSAFGRLNRILEDLARLPRKVAVIAAPEITKALRGEFIAGQDPYGRAWAPLRPATLERHAPPPLTDSGELAAWTRATVKGGGRAGVHVVLGKAIGYFAQSGFRAGRTRVPPRRILPTQGMPAKWRAILLAAARRSIAEARRA